MEPDFPGGSRGGPHIFQVGREVNAAASTAGSPPPIDAEGILGGIKAAATGRWARAPHLLDAGIWEAQRAPSDEPTAAQPPHNLGG